MQYAKSVWILFIIILLGYSFLKQENTSLDSLRTQAQEARQWEIRAREAREAREDQLSQALYDQCYSESLTATWINFDQKQRKSYECWREKINNSWTVTSANSEVPPKWKSIVKVQTSDSISDTVVVSVKKKWISEKLSVINVQKKEQTQSSEKSKSTLLAKSPAPLKVAKGINIAPTIQTSLKSQINTYWKTYWFAISMIQKWEWLHLKAYPDYKWCSIWWGTRAKNCNEIITENEANRRLAEVVKQVVERVRKDFPTLRPEAQWALVSFAYNCHSWYQSVRKNWLSYHSQWCKTAWNKVLKWLVARRLEERKIIFWK